MVSQSIKIIFIYLFSQLEKSACQQVTEYGVESVWVALIRQESQLKSCISSDTSDCILAKVSLILILISNLTCAGSHSSIGVAWHGYRVDN